MPGKCAGRSQAQAPVLAENGLSIVGKAHTHKIAMARAGFEPESPDMPAKRLPQPRDHAVEALAIAERS